jgi:tripartite-type tricarboxylate transporter receptor subunit TctC
MTPPPPAAPERPSRRAVLLGALAAGTLARPALAQADFPNRPIRFIVPYPPGGASDVLARLLAPAMTEILGQPLVVENRVGANGGIAAEATARATPDGYTIMMGNAGPNALNQALYGNKLPYDSVRDFTPISMVSKVPQVLAVNKDVPADDLQGLLAFARSRPGDVTYAVGGIGSAPHLTMEQIADFAGVRWTSVPFRGGQLAITAVLAGQVQAIMDTSVTMLPQVRDGRMKGIAVTSIGRVPQAPDLKTVAEQGFPGFEATSWGGVVGPPKLPEAILARLNAAVVGAMAKPEVNAAIVRQGVEPKPSTPAEFGAFIESEVKRWTAVVQKSGIRPE